MHYRAYMILHIYWIACLLLTFLVEVQQRGCFIGCATQHQVSSRSIYDIVGRGCKMLGYLAFSVSTLTNFLDGCLCFIWKQLQMSNVQVKFQPPPSTFSYFIILFQLSLKCPSSWRRWKTSAFSLAKFIKQDIYIDTHTHIHTLNLYVPVSAYSNNLATCALVGSTQN